MDVFKEKAVLYGRMIKITHSVFALPFAFTGAILAASGVPSLEKLFWITVAMAGARSGAMGLNRIIDRKIDAENPRTAGREIPSGAIRVRDAAFFTVISFAILLFAAYMLNPLCLTLSPLALFVLLLYSYTKRFTWMAHFVLGIAIAAAPLGAWIAVRGTFDAEIVPLSIAVVFWLAGFDVLYALQDVEFDRSYGLHSIPQRFGIRNALLLSRTFHSITWVLLGLTGVLFHLNFFYWTGMAFVAGLLLYEHSLVKPHDLSRLDMAFFNMNGYISVAVFVFTSLSLIRW
ncbi:MAG: putative 4-hydroxybenzoate polyprenyltransferase [Alphaproteobacteria bacterium]|uniref:4-hydroxybenzoate polyprenyltransferase n=1 Tax=Candidatus Nitrobium versatile TaxID=2884831 RepID=A0A953M387_9BACT|nr:putative 4-hydroxybenzoate polyprenyltransferase [Candidatus Nitrobium versatile]